jgi:hypothetical protein
MSLRIITGAARAIMFESPVTTNSCRWWRNRRSSSAMRSPWSWPCSMRRSAIRSRSSRSAGELLQDRNEIQRWDEVERQLRALAKGVHDANLRRKRGLGRIILQLYAFLPSFVQTGDSYLRPFYEEMKAIYLRARKKRSEAQKSSEYRDEPTTT